MALQVLRDGVILLGSWNVSGDHNEVKLNVNADMHERTTFGATTHTFYSGIKNLDVDGKGFINFDDSTTPKGVDYALFTEIGASSPKALTLAPDSTDGQVCWVAQMPIEQESWSIMPTGLGSFDMKAKCGSRFGRGKMIIPITSRSSTTTGTIYQLGALSSSQVLIAGLHVTAFDGTSLDVVIKSNDTNNTTTPTDRITFTQATGTTSQFSSVAGAITDTYWYAVLTFTGTSFTAAVSAAIVTV